MFDSATSFCLAVQEIFTAGNGNYSHQFFQQLLPLPEQFGSPIPFLLSIRQHIGQLSGLSKSLEDAIQSVEDSLHRDPHAVSAALGVEHRDTQELHRLARQLHHRLLGLLYGVLAAARIPEQHELSSLNSAPAHLTTLLQHLHQCGYHWDLAWQYPLQDDHQPDQANGATDIGRVDQFLLQAAKQGWLQQHAWPRHATTFLTVRRLLMFLLEPTETSQIPTFPTDTQLLPVPWVREYSNAEHNRRSEGVIRGIRLQKSPLSRAGWFPDPVTFGVTLFDSAMQKSIEIAGRLAWQSLQGTSCSICISPALLPQINSAGFQSPLLSGGSAGGLIGCGLFAIISGQQITAGLTASVALKFKDPDRTLSPTDLTVLIEEIHCEPVLGAEYKLGAAAAAGLRGTALHEHNRIDAENYLNQTPENRCRPTYVDDFQQLYRYLTRGFHIDCLVALESQTMQEHWTQARNGQTLDNQRHHLDVFVKPRLSLRVSRTKHQAGRITEKWRKLTAGVGRLLNQHLLPSDQWLIIHEDAGGGKTVLSWLLAAALSRLPHKFWVVHYEGQEFPRDLRLDLETRLQGKLLAYGITQSAAKVLEDLLEQRRVVVIYDALDQDDSKDSVNRMQRMRKDQQLAGLRLIVTSRPYAVNQNYAAEFHREYWLHCRLELFDQRQQASYQRQVARLAESRAAGAAALVRTAYQQLLPEPEQVADLLRYPVVQKQLRTIIEEHLAANSSGPLRPFKNAGDLYWEVANRLLDRAFKSRRYQDQLHHRVNLMKLLACYGYLMMLRFRTYKVRTQAIPQIRSEVKQRFAGTADDWQICSDILVDTSLTEHLLLKENAERALSFPSLKMAEFFAALYLGCYCDADVVRELQPEIGDGKWDNVWRFVAELPETTNRQGDPVAVPASLSCSLQALFAVPNEGRERPTESMFRAWQVLQRNTWLQQVREPVLAGWRHQFRRLLIDGYELGRPTTRARTAAEVLLDGDLEAFVRDAVVFEQRQLKPRLRELRADDLRDADQETELSLLESQWQALNKVVTSVQDWCQSLRPDFTTYALCSDDKTGHAERLTFLMGASEKDGAAYEDEKPWQQVTVPSFHMATACVTRAQYALFDPQREREHSDFAKYAPEPDCPMIYVNFFDGICFALWLGDRYSLPSEVQWEGAAWGGLDREQNQHYVIGVPPYTADFTSAQVNFAGNHPLQGRQSEHRLRTVPVRFAKFQPNGFGLWQMSGNVLEYTRSEWHQTLQDAIGHKDDDLASGSAEPRRCVRGGSWLGNARYTRCSYRGWNVNRYIITGIRLSRTK